MTRTLDGMVVAITGASAGIGLALAEALAAQGARLALAARRRDRLDALVARLGDQHMAFTADVADPAACAAFITAACARFGRLDTLVCNAGYGLAQSVVDTDENAWLALLRTNVLGTTACIRAAAPFMLAQSERDGWRAQVMIVSSALARHGKPGAGAYSATKAAQLSVAEALRVEWRAARIAVTSVHPVGTETEFDAAASAAGGSTWRRLPREPRQSAEQVAVAMIRAIRRPRCEVWPYTGSRWALLLAAALPSVIDWRLARGLRD